MHQRRLLIVLSFAILAMVACKNPISTQDGDSAVTIVNCSVAGRTDVLLTDAVAITFSASMDEAVTQGAMSLLPALSGTYEWSDDSTVLTFLPDYGFQPDTNHSLLVAERATDASGNTLAEAYSASFRTLPLLRTPQNVVAAVGPGYVDVSWDDVSGADGYTVYWSTVMGAGTSGTAVQTTAASHRHEDVAQGEDYFFVVRARRGTDLGPVSIEVSSSVRVLAAPDGTELLSADGALILSWEDVPLATSYNVYWSTTPGSGTAGSRIAGITPPFEHEPLVFGRRYYYTVTAENSAGEGLASAEESGIPLGTFGAPPNVSARADLASVIVEWEPVDGATQYNVYWSQTPDPSSGTRITVASAPFTHSGLTNGEEYSYVVAAANEHVEGDLSAAVASTAGHVLITDVPFADANLAAAVIATGDTYVHEVTNLSTGWGTPIADLTGLEYLWRLTRLYTNGTYTTLAPLAAISTIERLGVRSANLVDVTAVATMPNLREFSVDYAPALTDLSALSSCHQLNYLYLYGANNVSDFSFLSSLQELWELSVWYSPVTDSSFFQGLPDLYWLTLGYLPMTDLSGIQNLPSLYGLDVYGLSISDLGFLSGLPILDGLFMESCGLDDVSSLGSLTSLWELSLAFNAITDVSPLSNLELLEYLDLEDNEITTGVTSLVTLTSATEINFTANYDISTADLDTLEAALGPGVVIRP